MMNLGFLTFEIPYKGEKEEDEIVEFHSTIADKSSNESAPLVSRMLKYLV